MSTYCTIDDINAIFGAVNVAKWSNLDGQADVAGSVVTPNLAAINYAINVCSTQIDDMLRDGPYSLPLTLNAQGGNLAMLASTCATLAGVYLYEHRGIEDRNEITGGFLNKYGFTKKAAMEQVERWKHRVDHAPFTFNRMFSNIPLVGRR